MITTPLQHYLSGYIAELCDEDGDKEKIVMIVEVVQPADGKLTRIMYLEENGKIGRNTIGTKIFKVLPITKQITAFNELFYKYIPAPDHLKAYVDEEPQQLKK